MQSHLSQGRAHGQQGDSQILARAGVDYQAHKRCPAHTVADGLEHQTEGNADGDVPHKHRYGGRKGRREQFAVHDGSPRCVVWAILLSFSTGRKQSERFCPRKGKRDNGDAYLN